MNFLRFQDSLSPTVQQQLTPVTRHGTSREGMRAPPRAVPLRPARPVAVPKPNPFFRSDLHRSPGRRYAVWRMTPERRQDRPMPLQPGRLSDGLSGRESFPVAETTPQHKLAECHRASIHRLTASIAPRYSSRTRLAPAYGLPGSFHLVLYPRLQGRK